MATRGDGSNGSCRSARASTVDETRAYDWDVFATAYAELRRHGVPHDAASDKTLYLVTRGPLPEACNWSPLARNCYINEARRADNSRCIPLSEPVGQCEERSYLTLADVLVADDPSGDPEHMTLVRDDLRRVPLHIIRLFTNRDRPLTNTEYSRIHRFRRALRDRVVKGVPNNFPS